MTEREFERQFIADCITSQERGRLMLEISRPLGIVLVGQLQLALRHPVNRGAAAEAARLFVEELIERLSTTDVLREGLRRGDDPAHDTRWRRG